MARIKAIGESGGGGNSFDFSNPDKQYINNTATSSTSQQTIPVTQKPRLIVYSQTSRDSSYAFMLGIIDVKNNKAIRGGYYASTSHTTFEEWPANVLANYFPTISDSAVVVNPAYFGATSRIAVSIYY